VSAAQLTESQRAFATRVGINVSAASAGELELVARGESLYNYYKRQGVDISPQEAMSGGSALRERELATIAEDAAKKTPEYRRAQELGLKDPVTGRVKAEQILDVDKRPAKPTTRRV